MGGGCGTALANAGNPFDAASIGSAFATRAIMADLRAGMNGPLGGSGGGPPPFRKEDRSRFLQALDRALARLGRVTRYSNMRRGSQRPFLNALKDVCGMRDTALGVVGS